jgi:hypothetical protein
MADNKWLKQSPDALLWKAMAAVPLFRDNFDTETVNALPNPSPPGVPTGDRLLCSPTGSARIALTPCGGKGLRMRYVAGAPDTAVRCKTAGTPPGGIYSLMFRFGLDNVRPLPALHMAITDPQGRQALSMQLSAGHIVVYIAGGKSPLKPGYSANQCLSMMIQLHMGLKKARMFIGQALVLPPKAFNDLAFAGVNLLEFRLGPCQPPQPLASCFLDSILITH